jgi:DNA-binding MarR family transcriptional regulator
MKSRSKKRFVALDERVGYRFSVIARRLDQALAAMHSKAFGISVSNWKIMSVLACLGPLSATKLGARTSLDPDKITRAVDTLVQQSYVIRKDDENDRRRVVLTLSARGRRAYDKIAPVAAAMEAEFLSVLTPEEQRLLLSCMSKLEQHSSVMFGRREGWYERRHLTSMTRRASKLPARSGKRDGRRLARNLVHAK